MNICARHFDELKTALQHKGMWYLVDMSPEVVAIKTRHWLAGKTSDEQFDPFVAAMCEIRHKALELCGPAQFWSSRCPLCQVVRKLQNSQADAMWIDNITDVLVLLCITNNIERRTVLLS